MPSKDASPEDRLARTLNDILASLDPEDQQQRLKKLSEAFMAPLTWAEKKAAKARAMQEMFTGMMAEAADTAGATVDSDSDAATDGASKGVEDLMGGMQELLGSLMGDLAGGSGTSVTDEPASQDPSTDQRTDDGTVDEQADIIDDQDDIDDEQDDGDMDLSGLLEGLMGTMEGLTAQMAPLMGPMMNIALAQMDQLRAQVVAEAWAQELEEILGAPHDEDSWRKLIEGLLANIEPER